MEKLNCGESVVLDNNKEYLCFKNITVDNHDYVYLITMNKPAEVAFAEQKLVDDNLTLEIINDPDFKQYLYRLFLSTK